MVFKMIKSKKTSLFKAISMSAFLGVVGASAVIPEPVQADVKDLIRSAKKELSDQELANAYLRKNPEGSTFIREVEIEYREKAKKVNSPGELKRLHKEYKEEKNAMIKMYANLERRDREIAALKARDFSEAPETGEPKGMSEARRLAAMCGRGETVGYSNYFGDPSFYGEKYPMIGREFADIEAVPLLRDKFLPKFDSRTRKFLRDKQLVFTSLALNKQRSGLYSGYHEMGGQKEYADKQLQISQNKHIESSKNLSDEMFRDTYQQLDKFRWAFPDKNSTPRDRSEIIKTGTEILSECRYFWANGNTVKYYDPREEENGFLRSRNRNKRIGIQPGFVVAEPVQRMGQPVAMRNLIENEYGQQVNAQEVSARVKKFEDQLGTEGRNESADQLIKRNFGDNFVDPSTFKSLEGGRSTGNGDMSQYQYNRGQQAERNLKGSMYDQFRNGESPRRIDKLDFNDIYQ